MRGLFAIVLMVAALFVSCGEKQKEDTSVVFKGTFLQVLDKATESVKQISDKAVLYEADALKIDSAGMKAEDIKQWIFVYYLPGDSTATVTYTDSILGPVEVIPDPTFEDRIIKKVGMELKEALVLMRKADYSDKFVAVNLRWPLYPGCDEPYYIFGCPDLGHVFVGVKSKKVTVEPFTK